MNYKSYGDLSEDIAASLFKVHGKDYDLVVGIPRSGIILPAWLRWVCISI